MDLPTMDRLSRANSLFGAGRSKFCGGGTLCFAILLFSYRLPAEQPGWDTPWDVRLELEDAHLVPIATLGLAEELASKMLATAGVKAHWNPARGRQAVYHTGCPNPALSIKVFFASPEVTRADDAKALGYTYPYDTENHRIVLSYYRLPPGIRNSLRLSSAVLAHMLVHEITHLLQRTEHHSHSGVMKKAWSSNDYNQMKDEPLPFEPEDLVLIRIGRTSLTRALCGDARPSAETAIATAKR